MPYVAPGSVHTPSTGVAAPTGWGTAVNTAFDWFGDDRPRARVYRTGAQSIGSSSNTTILFDAERYDVGGCHSTSVSTSRLTAPTGGLYMFGASVHLAINGTGRRIVSVFHNGTTAIASHGSAADGTYGNYLSISGMYELAANDYIELVIFQDSGGALNLTANAANSPEFYFAWVCNRA